MINCPSCGTEFPLSQGVLDNIRTDISKEIESEVVDKTKKESAEKIEDLEKQLDKKSTQIDELKKQEKQLRIKTQELEEKEKDIDLEILRGIDKEKAKVEEAAKKKITEEFNLQLKAKDKEIEDFKKTAEELKGKLEQRSQQLLGEVAELELEDLLKQYFPVDEITPVGKGIKGADVIQHVKNSSGQECGSIIWESKNTKNWNSGWIIKLKEDQRKEKADIAVIASVALPADIDSFDKRDGVWITNFNLIYQVALILRQNLVGLQSIRIAQTGMGEKVDLLYSYLCGIEFKQRVVGMVEAFSQMQEDLNRERRSMEQIWSKREKQIQKFVRNISGMYGDVRGIIGGALPEIETLELPLLESEN